MLQGVCYGRPYTVALRKESVDRNTDFAKAKKVVPVALRKESVDRNLRLYPAQPVVYVSLSARRAWIEIAPDTVCRAKLP